MPVAECLGTRALEDILDASQEWTHGDLHRQELEHGRQRFVSRGRRFRTPATKMCTVCPLERLVHGWLSRLVFSHVLVALETLWSHYTPEVSLSNVGLATRTSYEEASQAMERATEIRILRGTTWGFLHELAQVVEAVLRKASPPSE